MSKGRLRTKRHRWLFATATALTWCSIPVCASAQTTITIAGDLRVAAGTNPQTWHGTVSTVSGTTPQSVTLYGSLTIAAPVGGTTAPQPLACTDWVCTTAGCAATPRPGNTCDDHDDCTYDDRCDSTGSCAGTSITCTSDACATRTCNGSASCSITPIVPLPPPEPCVEWVCDGASLQWDASPAAAGTGCRQSAGDCDPAEYCDGVSMACPPDLLDQLSVCRPPADVCDAAEMCTGIDPACPSDAFLAGDICRPDSGAGCDAADVCDGTGASCPDTYRPAGDVCRPEYGACDVAELCTGVSPSCPLDAVKPAGEVCRAPTADCDFAEYCTGGSGSCPQDALAPSSLQCRAAVGPCDVAESCSGNQAACPADVFVPAGTPCPSDVPSACNGAGGCAELVLRGEGAEYVYDAGGNVLQIRAATAAAVSIVDFTPREAGIGQSVTVLGSGFSSTRSLNQVTVNGVSAPVLSATPTSLTFAVPAGASTGKIAVTTFATTATSVNDLLVVTGVAVSDFTPKLGKIGTVLTVSGFNFDPNPSGNSVAVGSGATAATSASLTTLLATVGANASSGKVVVATSLGAGVSADDFFLVPGEYVPPDIGFMGRAAIAAPIAVNLTTPGKKGLVLFDGRQAQFLTVYVSGVTFAGTTTVTVYAPGGTSIFSGSVTSGHEAKFVLPTLPSTGTYTIAVAPPPTGTGKLDLQVFVDAEGVLQPGIATPVTLARGQNGRVTFTANAGDQLGLACTAFATDPVGGSASVSLHTADGTQLSVRTVNGPVSWQLPTLPTSGTYTLLVRPSGTAGASTTFVVSEPKVGTIAVDGPVTEFQNSVAGQAGRFTFTGSTGDLLGLGVAALATTPADASVSLYVYGPDGTTLEAYSAARATSWQLPELPTTGTYTLEVRPSGTSIVTLSLILSRPLTGTLSSTGTPTTFRTDRIGQAGRYTFSGTAGQWFTLRATADSSLSTYGASVNVYPPSGESIGYTQFSTSTDVKIDLGALPASGTYTVVVVPSGVKTGAVDMALIGGATDTLVPGDPPKALTLGASQDGRYTFDANAGDWIGVGITALVTEPLNTSVAFIFYKPDGGLLYSLSASRSGSWQLPRLPMGGVYTLAVRPSGTASAALEILLSQAITGTLPTDGTTMTYATARVGQPGRYTFEGVAGRWFTMRATAGASFSTYGVNLNVYQPSGESIGYTQFSTSTDVKIDLGALPASGTYTVVVVPSGVKTGAVDMALIGGATDTLVMGDPPKALALGPAQNGRYTFVATTGDQIGVGITAMTIQPPGGTVSFAVYRPDGTSLHSFSASLPGSWQLPQLPSSGTYTLAIRPPGTASATVTMLISDVIIGTLATDGTPTRHSTERVGQSGWYTFSGIAGERFTMRATGALDLSGTMTVTVYQPSGASIGSAQIANSSDKKIDLGALPATGGYTVKVVPSAVATGTVDLRLMADASDALFVGDPPKTLTLAIAQNGRYAFAGNAGDLLNLAVTTLTTTPTNAYVYFYVYKPDGASLWSGSASAPRSAVSWQLPQLPVAGTYTLAVKPSGAVGATFTTALARR